eukprot:SAG11_NODE_40368_length_203_cov_36.855769_1_plen_31_part_01
MTFIEVLIHNYCTLCGWFAVCGLFFTPPNYT